MQRSLLRGALVLLLLTSSACTAEVYHGLEEAGANEMIVVLEQHGIPGDKVADPGAEGKWVVTVPSQSRVEAWRVLKAEGLPRPDVQGFNKVYPTGGLIPTANEERVLLQYATAQELRRSLLTIDGVVDAHVNLVLPKKARVQLPNSTPEKPRASVVVKFRPASDDAAPLTDKEVQDMVLGGVEGIAREDVTVLLKAEKRSQKPLQEPRFEQIGPIAVNPSSKTWLQVILGVMCLLIMGLGAALGFVLLRRNG